MSCHPAPVSFGTHISFPRCLSGNHAVKDGYAVVHAFAGLRHRRKNVLAPAHQFSLLVGSHRQYFTPSSQR